ncbi:MAG TPA: phosphotransferase [Symbiobacteriaceae bacterium]
MLPVRIAPVIPGSVCEPASAEQASAVGAALGTLVKAMGRVTLAAPPGGTYGDLEQIDPLLPDPLAAAALPLIDSRDQKRLARLLADVMAERQSWYATLPRQFIHGDCVPFNVLMVGARVSAILDFELACRDIRAMDFAIGLWPWLRQGEAMADAFARGYTSHQAFTFAEAEALPFLLRLRRAATLVWWAGRYLHGTAGAEMLQWAVSSALQMADWLEANRAVLIARASQWAAGS